MHNRQVLAMLLTAGMAPAIAIAPLPRAAAESRPTPVAQLRAQGPAGLQQFLATLTLPRTLDTLPPADLRQALDRLCQQRDCHASQLFWYTDFAQAKASGKPILSLRLLGRLDEELSCANSRFFRVALYANREISRYLRDRYILHWESVRPVPKITIDFGDGRKLVRTATGNSIHYILDPTGQPVDALPGLYGPQAFLTQLQQAEQAARTVATLPTAAKGGWLRQYHRDRLNALQTRWQQDLQALGIAPAEALPPIPPITATDARTAGQMAMTKMVVETPLIAAITTANRNQTTLTAQTTPAAWEKLAARYAPQAQLDARSRALIRSKQPQITPTQLATFERTMALDTVRNEYQLHAQIHQQWLAPNGAADLAQLNQWVYARLFLTPDRDRWLGLRGHYFSAIENDGQVLP